MPVSYWLCKVPLQRSAWQCHLNKYIFNNNNNNNKRKGKGFQYSFPSVGPGADPGVQAIRPQVTTEVIHPAEGCHYFPPGLQLPSQLHSITDPWPVPSYTAWWQRHICVNNVPKLLCSFAPSRIWMNPWPVDRKSNALPIAPPCHTISYRYLQHILQPEWKCTAYYLCSQVWMKTDALKPPLVTVWCVRGHQSLAEMEQVPG